jgi:hypothetical protein
VARDLRRCYVRAGQQRAPVTLIRKKSLVQVQVGPPPA